MSATIASAYSSTFSSTGATDSLNGLLEQPVIGAVRIHVTRLHLRSDAPSRWPAPHFFLTCAT